MIVIERRKRKLLCFRSFVIYVDGKRVGRLKRGKQLRLTLPFGQHELCARIDHCMSKPYKVMVHDDETIHLYCNTCEKYSLYMKNMLVHPDKVLYFEYNDKGLDENWHIR